MSEIEEGDQVVTPEGRIGKAKLNREAKYPYFVSWGGGRGDYEKYKEGKLVRVDQPIRVRVSREFYAESLVELAEEHGWHQGEFGLDEISNPDHIYFVPEDAGNKGWDFCYIAHVDDESRYDLTYRDDLTQIEAWLEAHSESEERSYSQRKPHRQEQDPIPDGQFDNAPESEDECETCEDRGYVFPERSQVMAGNEPHIRDCPNCTNESEEYDEPRPEDEELKIPQEFNDHLTGIAELVGRLQTELQDCWENQQEYKNDVAELQVKLHKLKVREKSHKFRVEELEEQLQDVREEGNFWEKKSESWKNGYGRQTELAKERFDKIKRLQERIDEARDYVKNSDRSQIAPTANTDLLEILFQDSGEGDGEFE